MLYLAATLLIIIGLAHSYLGERYILIRLFRKNNLPRLFGGTEFTQKTLRFAWHITTLAWFGFAVVLVQLAGGHNGLAAIGTTISITFLLHAGVALVASKGKHLSWIVFLAIGLSILYAAYA